MMANKTRILKTLLSAIHVSGAHNLMAPLTAGVGAIFMLHRVSPEPVLEFEPNRILRITPDFLEQVIVATRRAGFDICSMDEAHERLMSGRSGRAPFACFTFDDGYRDNLEHALPVLKRHGVPATIYVPSDYPSGKADLWWVVLEHAIRALDEVELLVDGENMRFSSVSAAEKEACFDAIYWRLRNGSEARTRALVADLAARAGIDALALARDLIMTWEEVATLARDPLITIGAHTRGHFSLAKLSTADCEREMIEGIAMLEDALDFKCRHLAYPYGDEGSAGPREFALAERLGLVTGVTTRKGIVHAGHRNELMALPRVSLNGDFQDLRYVDVLLSGAPFALLASLDTCRRAGRRLARCLA